MGEQICYLWRVTNSSVCHLYAKISSLAPGRWRLNPEDSEKLKKGCHHTIVFNASLSVHVHQCRLMTVIAARNIVGHHSVRN